MAGRSNKGANPNLVNIPLDDVPMDGTPLSVTATVHRQLGTPDADASLGEADFEDGQWHIYRQTHEGWTFIDERKGRPYDPDLRQDYGIGKYKIMPVDLEGKPVEKFGSVANIGKATSRDDEELPAYPPDFYHRQEEDEDNGEDDKMPAWMRWQMQQAAEEKTEARRRAEEGDLRRQEGEQESRRREYEREERREREEKSRIDREREDRQARTEQQNIMMGHAVTLLGGFMQSKQQQQHTDSAADVNERMLSAILAMQQGRNTEQTNLRQSIEMLALLDSLRAPEPAAEKDEENDLMKTIGSVAPMIAMLRGGGGAAALPDPSMIQTAVKAAFQDPDTIAQIAAEDPKGVAQTMVSAVKSNPGLEIALVDAFEEQKDDE